MRPLEEQKASVNRLLEHMLPEIPTWTCSLNIFSIRPFNHSPIKTITIPNHLQARSFSLCGKFLIATKTYPCQVGDNTIYYDNTDYCYDAYTGKSVFASSFPNHRVIAVDPCKNYALTQPNNKTIYLWDTQKNMPLCTLNHPQKVRFARFSPYGNYCLTSTSNAVYLWDIKTKTHLKTFANVGYSKRGIVAELSPCNKYLLTCNGDTLRLFDIKTDELIFLADEIYSDVRFSPNGKHFVAQATGFSSEFIHIFNTESFQRMSSVQHKGRVSSAVFSPCSNYLLINHSEKHTFDQVITLWHVTTGTKLYSLKIINNNGIINNSRYPAIFSPCGKYIFTLNNNTVSTWELNKAQ